MSGEHYATKRKEINKKLVKENKVLKVFIEAEKDKRLAEESFRGCQQTEVTDVPWRLIDPSLTQPNCNLQHSITSE